MSNKVVLTIEGGTSGTKRQLIATVWEKSYDSVSNTSDIGYELHTNTNASSNYYSTGPTTLYIGDNLVIDWPRYKYGETYKFPVSEGSTGEQVLKNVKHNLNGKKSLTITYKTAIAIAEEYATTKTDTLVLTDIDRTPPAFATGYPKAKPETATTAEITFKATSNSGKCDFKVINTTNGEEVKKSDVEAGTEASVTIATKSSTNTIKVICTKQLNGVQITSDDVSVDCTPPNCILSVEPIQLNKYSATVKCTNYDYFAKLNKDEWSPLIDKNKETIHDVQSENLIIDVTAQTKRSDCEITSDTVSKKVDMRINKITDVKIFPNGIYDPQTGLRYGTLQYKCDLGGKASWRNPNGQALGMYVYSDWDVTGSTTTQNRTVALDSNGDYEFTIENATYSVLKSSVKVPVNIDTNTARIDSVTQVGRDLQVVVEIMGSFKTETGYKPHAQLENSEGISIVDYVEASTIEGNLCTFIFKEPPINRVLNMSIIVTNANSDIRSTIILVDDRIVYRSTVYIKGADGNLVSGACYVLVSDEKGKRFVPGIPYVCVNDGSENTWAESRYE